MRPACARLTRIIRINKSHAETCRFRVTHFNDRPHIYHLNSMTTLRVSLGDSGRYEMQGSVSNKIKRAQPKWLSQFLPVYFSQG